MYIQSGLKNNYFEDLKLGATLGVVILFLYVSGIGCPIKFITGLSSAGCGMSRAAINLIQGNFAEAFTFHPLILLMPASRSIRRSNTLLMI